MPLNMAAQEDSWGDSFEYVPRTYILEVDTLPGNFTDAQYRKCDRHLQEIVPELQILIPYEQELFNLLEKFPLQGNLPHSIESIHMTAYVRLAELEYYFPESCPMFEYPFAKPENN